jgi:tRNA1(Val) A37 N6-methylase TrmN6
MSINIAEFIQDFNVTREDKLKYGEIYTPFSLIRNMLSLFEPSIYTKKNMKWLDTGAGTGYFSIILFELLNKGLEMVIVDEVERKAHIIENMLYMAEYKENNIYILKQRFGQEANIISGDYLSLSNETIGYTFDIIIGNPPYNANGIKKVPTNNKSEKKLDGQTVWGSFIKKSLSLLKPITGQLCYIVPSIWMKPDKAGIYSLLTNYKIEKIHCMNNTETNKIFKGEAQTPTCYFLLTNIQNSTNINSTNINSTNINSTNINSTNLYDKTTNKYINYFYKLGSPLPQFGQTIIQKLQPFIVKAGCSIKVIKTNMPSNKSFFSNTYDEVHFPYINIKTCHLNDLEPKLICNFSNIPQPYYKDVKLVLAHKMYGFPFLDITGVHGISNRDNYIIKDKSLIELKQIKAFLSTKLAHYVYEATRYRMMYLEKYAFELMPDINNLPDFPTAENINDKSIAEYFCLSIEEQNNILHTLKRKHYGNFL